MRSEGRGISIGGRILAASVCVAIAGCGTGADDPPAESRTAASRTDGGLRATPSDRNATPSEGPGDSGANQGSEGPVDIGRRVIVISVDGLNPDAFSRARPLPTFRLLRRTGTATLNARTAFELTDTLPNHASMMTGRPVSGPHGHGITFNEDNGANLRQTSGDYVPSIFDVAHDHGLSTALFVSKAKFRVLRRSWDAKRGAPDTVRPSNGRNKLDTFVLLADPHQLFARAAHMLAQRHTDLTFLHLGLPDAAGHQSGFMSPVYLRAVRETGRLVRLVIRTVKSDHELRRTTTVLITSDHGGGERRHAHGDPEDRVNYTIPFFAWGVGVAHGEDLYDLNPVREDPGRDRPGYEGAQPIRNSDIANLSLALLDLPLLDIDQEIEPLDIS